MKMDPYSTIMTQGEDFSKAPLMGLNSEIFKERFGDYWKNNLPNPLSVPYMNKGEVISRPGDIWPRTETPLKNIKGLQGLPPELPGNWRAPTNPDISTSPENMPGADYVPLEGPGGYTPISDKKINPTIKSVRDALVEYVMGMSEATAQSLLDMIIYTYINIPNTESIVFILRIS